jgi:hypothetical protein
MHSMLRLQGLALLLLLLSATARAETINCTAMILPTTITAPGIYCLTAAANVAGNAIMIASDDVVIDLNGHAITGNGGGVGIQSTAENRITVRNGTVRRFGYGIALGNAGTGDSLVVEHMRVEESNGTGIQVIGRAGVVRHNKLINNGGTPGPGARYGINVSGPGSHVHDNEVVDTGIGAPGEVDGIRVAFAAGSVVQRNVVSNSAAAGAFSRGILFMRATQSAAVDNRVNGFASGIAFSGSSGIYMDNTVGGATTPFSGGTAAGATNFSF